MSSVVLVQRGGLILRNCLISLRSLPKNLNTKVPALVALPNTKINLVNCEFMGNENNITGGCLLINSDAVMSSCKFSGFKAGAIFSVADTANNVVIQDCEISRGSLCGIYT